MPTYTVGGISLPLSPIMIGAGACKTPESTYDWLQVATVVSGSYTPEPRSGNEGNRLFYPDSESELRELGFGLNSFGMPNVGFASAASKFTARREHPLVISVAGFSIEDYLRGLVAFRQPDVVEAIEFNFGCPNTDHGKIMSFDPESLCSLLWQIDPSNCPPIWVKLSPYSDPGLLKEIAMVLNEASARIKAVVTCNTFPSAYAGKEAISPMGGLAGMSGPALKPIALGQVVQFRKHLLPEIDVIGVGGITTGNDVVDFLEAGAKAVQTTSLPFWLGKPNLFWDALLDEKTGNRLTPYIN